WKYFPGSLLLLVWLFICLPGTGMAQGKNAGQLTLDEKALWGYAQALFDKGEYYRAISEYQRLLHFFPGSTLRGAAQLRIAEGYLNGREPQAAVAHLDSLLGGEEWKPIAGELLFLRAAARLEIDALRPYPLRQANISLALEDLRNIPEKWAGTVRAKGFLEALGDEAAENSLPLKSPWLAGGLSAIVPGTGSFYVGRYREGFLSLFVNALFIHAAANAWNQGREGLGAVLGTGALAFYGGNIYASVNGAHKHNDGLRAGRLDEARLRFGLSPRPGGIFGQLEAGF
ncbi:MAG: hypothetical protein OEZ59_13150, partial [Deltaproteobacteria bacterium]|nr:hypothetical protein [Deltaproteobacteria bacterium]